MHPMHSNSKNVNCGRANGISYILILIMYKNLPSNTKTVDLFAEDKVLLAMQVYLPKFSSVNWLINILCSVEVLSITPTFAPSVGVIITVAGGLAST